MSRFVDLLRNEPRARPFFLAYAQSAIGTGAGAAALVVLAYQRYHSPWAIALVLLATFLPGMALGPVFGAAADRGSRRSCAILADVLRAVAFAGIAVVGSFPAMVALAAATGIGSALFAPSILAALPSLVDDRRRAAVTSLYGATTDIGRTVGPLVAALAFPLVGANGLMVANAASFAISACVLARVRFGAAPAGAGHAARRSLLRETAEGVRLVAAIPLARTILAASTMVVLFASMLNVAELLIAHRLGAGAAGFSWLVTVFGLGIVCGSVRGARGGSVEAIRTRYLTGLALAGVSLVFLGSAPSYWLALPAFFLTGLANGIVVVHERLLYHAIVPDRLLARGFALLETTISWAFAIAYVAAGALVVAVGVAPLMTIAGGGCIAVWLATAWAFARASEPAGAAAAPLAPKPDTSPAVAAGD